MVVVPLLIILKDNSLAFKFLFATAAQIHFGWAQDHLFLYHQQGLKLTVAHSPFALTSCFALMIDSAVVYSALVDAALRKSGLI